MDGDADRSKEWGRSEGETQLILMKVDPFPATVDGDCQEEK